MGGRQVSPAYFPSRETRRVEAFATPRTRFTAPWTQHKGLSPAIWPRPCSPALGHAAELLSRTELYLGARSRKLQRTLVDDLLESAPKAYPPSPKWLENFLLSAGAFERAAAPARRRKTPPPLVLQPPYFAPSPPLADLDVPKLTSPGDLAQWLGVEPGQLDWLADARRQHGVTNIPVLQHYLYTFVPKRTGPPRLIEAPKPRLMAIQRRILREILDLTPAHDRAHGFVRGRSCVTAAQRHAGECVVVTVDLEAFFPTTPIARVHGIFRSLGYPWAVARLLTGLCATCTPASILLEAHDARLHEWRLRKLYGAPHLPQGAPTSPALANLAAWRLDQRLAGLANSLDADYTRYADDLAFSGDEAFAGRTGAFLAAVERIAADEGYGLNHRKTRVMRRNNRQRITGVVVNDHLNAPRAAYDQLKATLHNCARRGPEGQNRSGVSDFRAHLDGRVRWVETLNPQRGARLRRIFETIRW